jgi:hypothetical protein
MVPIKREFGGSSGPQTISGAVQDRLEYAFASLRMQKGIAMPLRSAPTRVNVASRNKGNKACNYDTKHQKAPEGASTRKEASLLQHSNFYCGTKGAAIQLPGWQVTPQRDAEK